MGLDELLQFDWTLVGESDALADDLRAATVLDEIDVPAEEARLRKIREVIAERRRYLESSGLTFRIPSRAAAAGGPPRRAGSGRRADRLGGL